MKMTSFIYIGLFVLAIFAGYACGSSSDNAITGAALGVPETEITCGGSACIR